MRLLLTWSDWHEGRTQSPLGSGDLGPIRRLLAVSSTSYDAITILAAHRDRNAARALAAEVQDDGRDVSVVTLDVADPSDHAQLFTALGPVVAGLPAGADIDVLLSAGTPQAQTLWVVLVKAGLLNARMLQVIPPRFVPYPHPEPVREVRLDFDGFPEIRALKEEVVRLRARVQAAPNGLHGQSAVMRQLGERIARVGASRVPVLVLGETGTGKELVARAIHAASDRASGPFIAENCGTFAEGVLASELFGHEAGAFTGAVKRRRGLFEQADGGTLFLDEVGELSLRVQVQLLRVLQEGALRRVGGEAPVAIDVRVIAATHRDLPALVRSGEFREDLWYRLNGAVLEVPPLRERLADLEALVVACLADVGASHLKLARSTWGALQCYAWPGNVRELRAEVARWAVFCDDRVDVADLSPAIRAAATTERVAPPLPAPPAALPTDAQTLAAAVEAIERATIETALRAEDGNLSATARRLDVDRNTLKRKLAQFGLR